MFFERYGYLPRNLGSDKHLQKAMKSLNRFSKKENVANKFRFLERVGPKKLAEYQIASKETVVKLYNCWASNR